MIEAEKEKSDQQSMLRWAMAGETESTENLELRRQKGWMMRRQREDLPENFKRETSEGI